MKKLTTYILNLRIFQFRRNQTIKGNNEITNFHQPSDLIKNKNIDFVAIDVETAQGPRWSICQIGLAFVEQGEIKEIKCFYVQPPGNKYMPAQVQVHKITPDVTINKPTFPEIWKVIWPMIENKMIVAHNAEFDISCLMQALYYYRLEIPAFQYQCTFKSSGMSLEDACEAYDIDLSSHHNAECDALACAKIYLKLITGIKPTWTGKPTAKSKPRMPYDLTGHDRIQGKLLKPDLVNSDPSNPFYGKKVVFTGVLYKIDRQDAAMKLKSMGADIDSKPSIRTDFVIVGKDAGWKKMEDIEKFNASGSTIKVIYEDEFLKMIKL